MNRKVAVLFLLLLSLSACDGGKPPAEAKKSFGGQLGDSYKGMLDEAKQGVEHANDQMQRTEQAVRDR